MKRQQFLALFFALICVGLAGTVLREYDVPVVRPAAAQDVGQPQSNGPMFGGRLAPASPAARKAAAASIRAQLQAFAKDDYEKAEQYQSLSLKGHFGTVAHFRQIITTNYPEFAHYKSVQFGDARSDPTGQRLMMRVTLTGQNGVTLQAVYIMVKEGKTYHVDGVMGGVRAPLPASPGSSTDA